MFKHDSVNVQVKILKIKPFLVINMHLLINLYAFFNSGGIIKYKRDLLRILKFKYETIELFLMGNISISCFILIITCALIVCDFEQFVLTLFTLNTEYF